MTFPVIRVPIWSRGAAGILAWRARRGSPAPIHRPLGSNLGSGIDFASRARHANQSIPAIVPHRRARSGARLVRERPLWSRGADRLAREPARRDHGLSTSLERQKRRADRAHLI